MGCQASSAQLSPWWQHLKWHPVAAPAVHHWGCRETCRSGDHNFGRYWDFWSSWNHQINPGHFLQRRDSPESSPTFSRFFQRPRTKHIQPLKAIWIISSLVESMGLLSNAGPAAGAGCWAQSQLPKKRLCFIDTARRINLRSKAHPMMIWWKIPGEY